MVIKLKKRVLTAEEVQKWIDANESTKGTSDFGKYTSSIWIKEQNRGNWGPWKFTGHGTPTVAKELKVKKYDNVVYVMDEEVIGWKLCQQRYMVSHTAWDGAINELLDIYEKVDE